MALQRVQVVFILKHDVVVSEGSSKLCVLSRGPPLSLFNMLFMTRGGSRTWCFDCGSPSLLGGSFVFLDVGPSILFPIFPLYWVLSFIYDWQGFIIDWILELDRLIGLGWNPWAWLCKWWALLLNFFFGSSQLIFPPKWCHVSLALICYFLVWHPHLKWPLHEL